MTIAGVEGNGQSELAETITGLRSLSSGSIELDNRDISRLSAKARRDTGIGFIPEDRMETGLCVEANLEDNFIIGKHHRKPYSHRGLLYPRAIRDYARTMIRGYDIRVPGVSAKAKTLSGGNLQKVLVSREFSSGCRFYVVAQPTRGLDIGSQEFVHKKIIEMRDKGAAILLISTDLDEVFALSDRILVLYQGELTGEFRPHEITREAIGLYMTGVRRMNLSHGGEAQ